MDAGQRLTIPVWARRLIRWAIIIELAWLVLVNALLNLPLTQEVVNMIRPDKYFVSWDSAWSPWPGRVHVLGAGGNGNSRSQMWEFKADRVAGSIALLPLIAKRVWLRNIDGENVRYRQRPRPRPDRDLSAIEAWFPEITGREVTPAITQPLKKRPWIVSIRNIRLEGRHDYWIYNVRGTAKGTLAGHLDYESRGGPLELDVHTLELGLGRHTINGEHDLFQGGSLSGSVGFLPFRPRENRGVKLLDFLLLNCNMDILANDLSFINLFLLNFERITVSGEGRVSGRLHFDEGWVQPGTALAIDADNLSTRLMDYVIAGEGAIDLDMKDDQRREMILKLAFDNLSMQHDEDSKPMFTGKGLDLVMAGNGKLVPDPENPNPSRSIQLDLYDLAVPDLSLLQRYLPPQWPMRFEGGSGQMTGTALLAPTRYVLDLELTSDQADMSLGQYRFDTDINAATRFHNPDVTQNRTRVGGSYLALSDSRLKRDDGLATEPWQASLKISEGKFGLFEKQLRQRQDHVVDLFTLLRDTDFSEMLGNSSGEFALEASVSSLAWLGLFLGGNYDTEVTGNSAVEGFVALEGGLPQPGTWMTLKANDLGVRFLDYIGQGDGQIRLDVDEGGSDPDWNLALELRNAGFKRVGHEGAPYIKDVELHMAALVQDVNFDPDREREFDLSLRIPSARLTDLSIFNEDLPPDGPLRILSGEADLEADILLQAQNAGGYLRLVAPGIQALVDEQRVDAAMTVNIGLAGGEPRERRFDFSGSEIVLDRVRVRGEKQAFDEEDWSARLVLTRGETIWTQPTTMSLEADLEMSDSRPFVTLFANQGWRPDFLTRAMTVEDIGGKAYLELYDRSLLIPSSTIAGGDVEVAAKAWIEEAGNQGMLYARFRGVDALIRFENGKRNLDLFRVREKFDAYQPQGPRP